MLHLLALDKELELLVVYQDSQIGNQLKLLLRGQLLLTEDLLEINYLVLVFTKKCKCSNKDVKNKFIVKYKKLIDIL